MNKPAVRRGLRHGVLLFASTLLQLCIAWLYVSHMCGRACRWMEFPLMAASVIVPLGWIGRAASARQAGWRLLLSAVVSFAVMSAYVAWLHSDYFPSSFLHPPPPHPGLAGGSVH